MSKLQVKFAIIVFVLTCQQWCYAKQVGRSAFTQLKCDAQNTVLDVTEPVMILTNPEQVHTPCTFRFPKVPGICQIRLDFETFETASAEDDGECVVDSLIIHNSITVNNEFATCGNLNQQHMYLAHGNADSVDVTTTLGSASSKYEIMAIQVPCNSEHRAPDNCLQYFTSAADKVQSFDFGGQQQNNQRYNVCVKSEGSSIQWKPCHGVEGNAFDITTNIQLTPSPCNNDWVQMKGLPKVCEPFTEQVSQWQPFDLVVNFDEYEYPPPPDRDCIEGTCQYEGEDFPTPDIGNTGFCLEYEQL